MTVPWIRLDNRMPEHPKIMGLSDAAFRLWVYGLCQSSDRLTDGYLSPRDVPRNRRRQATELVNAGLWSKDADGWVIHDYLEWQTSRAEAMALSARNRNAALRRWRGKPPDDA